jgi:ABC-type Na+ efflux pump permease subunit
MRRLFLALLMALLPFAAQADNSTATTSDQSGSASSLQNTGTATASNQTSGILQPAEAASSSLQSADASGTGAAQSAVENLQQSGDSDQTKLMIEGEGDVPHVVTNSANFDWLLYILLVLVAGTIGTGAALEWQRRAA